MFEIEIDRVFAASHALRLADGAMEPVHGHNWPVTVTVAAEQLDTMDCVMDFHELTSIVDSILSPLNNRHLNDLPPFDRESNPSGEQVAAWIGQQVASQLPGKVSLVRVTVGEAPNCRAIYRPRKSDPPEI